MNHPRADTLLAVPTARPGKAAIEAREIGQIFAASGRSLPVLEDVTLTAGEGEFIVLIGPSGCGKSTLFSILSGLQSPTAGQVLVDGHDVTGRLGLTGYMPQKDLLLPWRTVLDNTIIGLEFQGIARRRARSIAREWLPRFGLDGFESHYPATLSGGMRQRAALLRTFLSGREILLLDEPFGALDALTRVEMEEWLLDVWSSFRKTVILITHDIDEAIYLADRVYVMTPRPGRIARIVDVSLPRPRRYEEAVTSESFATLKRELLSLLRHPLSGDRRP